MPKIEPKLVQKELEARKVRPVYYIYGPERMKSRELIRRVTKAVLGDDKPNDFNYEKWDGSEVTIDSILDSTQSFSMMGGTKLILVRNADDIKNMDPLGDYLKSLDSTEPKDFDFYQSVLVLVSKGFDARKKSSKLIQEYAAVIPCDEVAEQDREPWIDYLAKRRGLTLSQEERLTLRGLDPWSLEITDSELSKLELVGDDQKLRSESLLNGVSSYARDEFIDAIFCRDHKRAMGLMHLFSEEVEVQLPFLGLLSWNLRHLKLMILEQETRARSAEKRNPFLLKNLERWRKHWTLQSIQDLEHRLFEVDFSLKNTRLLGKGLWMSVIQ